MAPPRKPPCRRPIPWCGPVSARFALGTADFILCGPCGAYLGAILNHEAGGGYGIVNIRVLDKPAIFTGAPEPSVYDAENEAERAARRRRVWTPVAQV